MTVVWSDQSRSDLRAIYHFIARDSELYAGRQVQRLIAKVEQTTLMPTRGHPVHEFPEIGLRESTKVDIASSTGFLQRKCMS